MIFGFSSPPVGPTSHSRVCGRLLRLWRFVSPVATHFAARLLTKCSLSFSVSRLDATRWSVRDTDTTCSVVGEREKGKGKVQNLKIFAITINL